MGVRLAQSPSHDTVTKLDRDGHTHTHTNTPHRCWTLTKHQEIFTQSIKWMCYWKYGKVWDQRLSGQFSGGQAEMPERTTVGCFHPVLLWFIVFHKRPPHDDSKVWPE
jgi:hypothetical protein